MLLMSCCRSGFAYGTTVSPAVSSNKLPSHAAASQDVSLVGAEFRGSTGIPLNIRPHRCCEAESDVTKWSQKNRGFMSQVAMIESETGASLPKLCRAAT